MLLAMVVSVTQPQPREGLWTETEPIAQVICGGKVSDSKLNENEIICKIPPLVRHLLDYISSVFGQSSLVENRVESKEF